MLTSVDIQLTTYLMSTLTSDTLTTPIPQASHSHYEPIFFSPYHLVDNILLHLELSTLKDFVLKMSTLTWTELFSQLLLTFVDI